MIKQKYISYEKSQKIRIAILFQVASYWPSIESFYLQCVNDDEVEVRVFYVDDLSVEKVQMKDTIPFLQKNQIAYENYSEDAIDSYNPHAALYQPPYDALYRNPSALSIHLMRKGIRIFYIPYGIEIADTEDAHLAHFHTYVIKNCWRIYTFSKKMLEDYQRYCPNRHAVRAVGSPKFDSIFKGNILPNSEICQRAGTRKIVVWKMHFPKLIYEGIKQLQVTPELSEYIQFADHIEAYTELYFVVMPHPLFFSETIPEKLACRARELFEVLRTKSNVMIDLSPDYRNSLYNAEAIIVDRSALMVEAGLCGVPVLYMYNREYDEPLTDAVKCLVDTYVQGNTAADMQKFIMDFIEGNLQDQTDKQNAVIKAELPFMDGLCGKRILDDVKHGIKQQSNHQVRVVFFGAGAVCAHYLERMKILTNNEYEVLGIADNNSSKWNTSFAGTQIISPDKLKIIDFDVLVITSEQYHMPIKQKLVYELFIDEDKIMRLDVFSEIYFYQRFF